MIGWLSGRLLDRDPSGPKVVLDVSGVGYELLVSLQTYASLPAEGGECELWVHTYVREDQLTLYGFDSRESRRAFLMLTSVPKVGPRAAVSVLGGFPLSELIDAIALGEAAKLQRIPGIGKKTSEQIVLSLAEKILVLREHAGGTDGEPGPEPEAEVEPTEVTDQAQDTLVAWGWKSREVQGALAKVRDEVGEDELGQLTLEELLRRSMRRLTSR